MRMRWAWRRLRGRLLSLLTLCVLLLLCVHHSFVPSPPPPPLLPSVPDDDGGGGTTTPRRFRVNCSAIYEMDPVEVGKSLAIRRNLAPAETDRSLAELTSNCSAFLRLRGYDGVCVSEEEAGFPLAFSLVVHKSAWQVERLLRAVYSPANLYCVHYDRKSPAEFAGAMEGLARCLPNVFIASRLETVFYAGVSRLRADLNCLADSLRSEVRWRYVINLCGQDFPLRSNMELVSELRALGGANMLETSRPTEAKRQRFAFRHRLQESGGGGGGDYQRLPVRTEQEKEPPPHGIQVFTGNAYFVLSRAFVLHLNASPVVRDFLAWSEDTYSPDEHFWATLARLPGVPGEVACSLPDVSDLASRTRLVKWQYLEGQLYPPCSGRHVRSVCIFGAAELRWLLTDGHWFANKVDPQVDPVLVQCLEERLQERQRLFQSVTRLTCPQRRLPPAGGEENA